MISREVLNAIESDEFKRELQVVSSFPHFFKLIRRSDSVQSLFHELEEPENRQELADRTEELLRREANPRYQHPSDIPIAVYLWLLDLAAPEVARAVASSVARSPNTWWARNAALGILAQERSASDESGTSTTTQYGPPRASSDVSTGSERENSITTDPARIEGDGQFWMTPEDSSSAFSGTADTTVFGEEPDWPRPTAA